MSKIIVNVSGDRLRRGTFWRLISRVLKEKRGSLMFCLWKNWGTGTTQNLEKKIQFTPFQIQKIYWLLRNCTFWRITPVCCSVYVFVVIHIRFVSGYMYVYAPCKLFWTIPFGSQCTAWERQIYLWVQRQIW